MPRFTINGRPYEFNDDDSMPLLWYLREEIDLKGTKFGCGIGQCGACTVHVDNVAQRSCTIPVGSLHGREIKTIEGASLGEVLHPVQRAWVAGNVPQCGYCQPGQIMATIAFLEANPDPTDEEIDSAITNLCRCGTYNRIRKAIHRAAEIMRSEQ